MRTGYEDISICSKCKGACCKRVPGACFPEDFDLPKDKDKLIEALKSRKYQIDWIDLPCSDTDFDYQDFSNGRAYYIRPARKDNSNLYDPMYMGECSFLTETGCELKLEDRPTGCRMLEPKENFDCKARKSNKKYAALAWEPYHDWLSGMGKLLNREDEVTEEENPPRFGWGFGF